MRTGPDEVLAGDDDIGDIRSSGREDDLTGVAASGPPTVLAQHDEVGEGSDSQLATLGPPDGPIAFRRADGSGEIEVELSRDEYAALRDSGVLRAGQDAHLKPRRIRQFESGARA